MSICFSKLQTPISGCLFLAILLCACNTTTRQEVAGDEGAPNNFRDSIELRSLAGAPLDMSQFEGKVLILNLWATWCKPCIAEMPALVEMQASLPADRFSLLLASDEEVQKIERFLEKRPFELNFVSLVTSMESLGAYSLPTTLVIGPDGALLETMTGAREWNDEKQLSYFNDLIEE